MARITVEDCLESENNRFALVLLAAKRTKQILRGAPLKISDNKGNKAVVTALREIAAQVVRFMTPEEIVEAKALDEARARERAQQAQANDPAAAARALGDSLFVAPANLGGGFAVPEGEVNSTPLGGLSPTVGGDTLGTHPVEDGSPIADAPHGESAETAKNGHEEEGVLPNRNGNGAGVN